MSSPSDNIINYTPPGPVAEKFLWDEAFFTGLRGPVGSGKSSVACWKMLMLSLKQEPMDGVRRTRWAVVRNTYPELKSTTIKTWQEWFPDSLAPIKWDSPITSRLKIADIGDGTAVDMEVMFIPLDRPEEVGKLKSLELTGAWINEASEIDQAILDMLTQRVNRYPSFRTGVGPTWSGVIADTNPPDDDHWWYEFAERLRPDTYHFYTQPGALYWDDTSQSYKTNPDAENVQNIKRGYQYYYDMLVGKSDGWIRVYILGQYGSTQVGKPVYPEWNEEYHLAKEPLQPIKGLPLLLGWDFGLTPACVVTQMSPKGQVLVLREYVSDGMGIRQFASDVVRPALLNEFPNWRIESTGDPAGTQRAQTDEKTCMQELLEVGYPTEPASTNEFLARRESVAFWMLKTVAGQPGILVDPSCDKLRRGFNGRYKYERVNTSSGVRYKERPVKDEWSHPQDALQYACLKLRGNINPVRALPVVVPSAAGWT